MSGSGILAGRGQDLNFADFDGAAVFELRMIARQVNGVFVTVSVKHVVAAKNFLAFGEGTVR